MLSFISKLFTKKEEIVVQAAVTTLEKIADEVNFMFEKAEPTDEKELAEFATEVISEIVANTTDYETQRLNYPSILSKIFLYSPNVKRYFVIAAINWIDENENRSHPSFYIIQDLRVTLLKENLPLTEDELVFILRWAVKKGIYFNSDLSELSKVVQKYLNNNQMTVNLKKELLEFLDHFENSRIDAATRKSLTSLRVKSNLSNRNPLVAGEFWSDKAISDISSLSSEMQNIWIQLLNECQKASGSSPTAKWLKSVKPLIEEITPKELKEKCLKWFPLVDKTRTKEIATWSEWSPNPNLMLNDVNADILKGLVWLCGISEDKEIARALSNLAISAYKKVPKIGPRCVRVGNACVWALGQMSLDGVGQIAILKLKVKAGNVQKLIEKALNEAAQKLGLPPAEIEEMSVPTYGLEEVGVWRETFGETTAELSVTGTNNAEIRWFNAAGKQQKSVPKQVKDEFGEELKELNQALKDIKKMLPAQRDRIENLYLEEKTWDCKTWRERYLEHPLVGTIARRLIWMFDEVTTAIWLDGKLVDVHGDELNFFDDSQVKLWHPIHSATHEVLEWRDFLEKLEIQQPFKQAYREIYILTEAEIRTNTYSNRFAAHIIKQHQFNSLCGIRGWKNRLHLMVDDSYEPPTRWLPKQNLRAEFWIEAVGEEYGTDTTESGTYLYLATDQVRFYPTDAQRHYVHAGGGGYAVGWNQTQALEPIPLAQIPPLIFSEIMRDADMFVGVCSIGNDPNWIDGGREIHRDYWHNFSFGDLSATAKTRQEILERLIPRLKIAPKCSFEDKFLIVKGDLRTYKIHLGSGNILMLPNDQYLCIVASSSSETFGQGKVYLPFEGDRVLSIILSKAFMLAEDTKITDPTITRQIK